MIRKTFYAVRNSIPCNSTDDRGMVEILSRPCPPWETPVSWNEVVSQLAEKNGLVKGTAKYKRHQDHGKDMS